jgi:hypothetical protein
MSLRPKPKPSTATEQPPPSPIGEDLLERLRSQIAPRTDIPLPPAQLWDTDHSTFIDWESWALRKAEEKRGLLKLADAKTLAAHVSD